MKPVIILVSLFCLPVVAKAQLIVNQVDINELDIQYCQLICEYAAPLNEAHVYVDYGQSGFRENKNNELHRIGPEGKPTLRFRTAMQAVNFAEKNGWEVVSFQVTHTGGGTSSQFIYLMRKKQK
ncbi:hypothetical protein [Larkinella rosea]|uniref:Uncharacterized protein n=1 Tax=Larkinella rosea TaxID=2025312 RepID=A0A3P1BM71_9BACT|nr:hypothetical protein [Larkinella rosea]RRB02132.1 hypothetical protein EHT25_16745 [Larkinella rosea]